MALAAKTLPSGKPRIDTLEMRGIRWLWSYPKSERLSVIDNAIVSGHKSVLYISLQTIMYSARLIEFVMNVIIDWEACVFSA